MNNQADHRGRRVLYLDDEEPLVFLVTRMLKHLGLNSSGFTKATDALAAFRADPKSFSLIVTDLSMPGASGMDFAREVLTTSPGAAVIIVSGSVDPTDAARAKSIGARELIQKPATVEELGQIIGRLLRDLGQ